MQRAREQYPEQFDEVFREGTATLLAELANLKKIIGRFSDFAKMPAPELQPVDFNELVAREREALRGRNWSRPGSRAVDWSSIRRLPRRARRSGADDARAAQSGAERDRRHAARAAR